MEISDPTSKSENKYLQIMRFVFKRHIYCWPGWNGLYSQDIEIVGTCSEYQEGDICCMSSDNAGSEKKNRLNWLLSSFLWLFSVSGRGTQILFLTLPQNANLEFGLNTEHFLEIFLSTTEFNHYMVINRWKISATFFTICLEMMEFFRDPAIND